MVKVDDGPLSQPSDSDWKGKPHPAGEFKKDAETRNTNRHAEPPQDEFEMTVLGGKLFLFKGKGDWVKKWGGKISLVALALAIIAIAWWARGQFQ